MPGERARERATKKRWSSARLPDHAPSLTHSSPLLFSPLFSANNMKTVQKARDECVTLHGTAHTEKEIRGELCSQTQHAHHCLMNLALPSFSPSPSLFLPPGPDSAACAPLIAAHKVCLRAEGFNVE